MKFADTGWWVAWALPGDARHTDALGMLAALGQSEQVLTTNLVAGETWTFLRRKDSHRTALAFLDRLDVLNKADRLVVHRVTEDQEAAAWDWLRKHDERVYSYVDATSFRVMRDRRVREALAFDQDFAAAGFVEVQPGR
ncbi:type II toxin-antitoxin system VapC family toxin [Mycobacterium sp. pUA109]|uniref:type II toxin-antitoxin system VapC family toxin n=1 Tax=Mycobacterium sp. pUA109 TaxID=3238982 RepID=UPI00351B5EA3